MNKRVSSIKNDNEKYRAVAHLHSRNIDKGFLSSLGVGFLELMYEAIDKSPGSVLLCEVREGEIIGFVSGTVDMKQVYWYMAKKWLRLSGALVGSLLSLKKVRGIFEVMLHLLKESLSEKAVLPSSELLSIVVKQAYRGHGLAGKLYADLENWFKNKGILEFKIVVGDSLEDARKFYMTMGAVPTQSIKIHSGMGSTVYVQNIMPEK